MSFNLMSTTVLLPLTRLGDLAIHLIVLELQALPRYYPMAVRMSVMVSDEKWLPPYDGTEMVVVGGID